MDAMFRLILITLMLIDEIIGDHNKRRALYYHSCSFIKSFFYSVFISVSASKYYFVNLSLRTYYFQAIDK